MIIDDLGKRISRIRVSENAAFYDTARPRFYRETSEPDNDLRYNISLGSEHRLNADETFILHANNVIRRASAGNKGNTIVTQVFVARCY